MVSGELYLLLELCLSHGWMKLKFSLVLDIRWKMSVHYVSALSTLTN